MILSEFIATNVQRAKRWHPGFPDDKDWTGADWSNAMCGEAGEAANVVKKLRRVETGMVGKLDRPQSGLLEQLAEEIADTITYATLLAAYYGIDVEQALASKFNHVSQIQGFPERVQP